MKISVMKMAGDDQLSLCYFKNRIIQGRANELEEYAKKTQEKVQKGFNSHWFLFHWSNIPYSIFDIHNQDLKKKKNLNFQYSRKKDTSTSNILKDIHIFQWIESIWKAALSSLIANILHSDGERAGFQLCFLSFAVWGAFTCCPATIVAAFVVDLILHSFLLTVDPCLSRVRAFIFTLMQFYSSSDFCGEADCLAPWPLA